MSFCLSLSQAGRDFEQIDAWAKANEQTVVFAPWHPKPDFRIFKTGSLLGRNELYSSGLVLVNHKGNPVPWKKITTMEDITDIMFKECDTHKGLLFACERCPVCVIIEERDEALGHVAELEFELQEILQHLPA